MNLINALRPFADLLQDDHPKGTVFQLDVLADDVAAARAAIAQPGFTVCLQEVGASPASSHVSYQACATRDEAVQAAIRECRADWGWEEDGSDEDDIIHVFAVFAGDVEVLEWEDQA